MSNTIRKTQRKNKTKQVIAWPSHDEFFTIDDLVSHNPHMLTTTGSNITIRVRLNKAISSEGIVAVIGQKNYGKGRPKLIFAMRPVKQSTIEKAKTDNISLDMPKILNVLEITNTPQTVVPTATTITTPSVVVTPTDSVTK